jgi:hypothetical protein
MSSKIGIGIGTGLDGSSATRSAVHQALDQIGSARPVLVITIISHEYDVNESLKSITSYFTSAAIWGFSANGTFTSYEINSRCVFVIVLTDRDLIPQTYWWPQYASEPGVVAKEIAQQLEAAKSTPSGILFAADGVSGNINLVRNVLQDNDIKLVGILSGGDIRLEKTTQIADNQCGSGALSMLTLSGDIEISVGIARGWQNSGIQFSIDHSEGLSIHELDSSLPAEAYAAIFGKPVKQWSQPPLSELVRLYPLGIEKSFAGSETMIHSPLYVEPDGSFRMNIPLEEEKIGHLMIGNPEYCKEATRNAAEDALRQLGDSKPVLGLVWIDIAWQMLFRNDITPIIQVLQPILGDQVPLIGAFTLGHVVRPTASSPCTVSNQGLVITLIGKPPP